ncbi:MAG TPA: hypothetical protein VKB08_22170, partial [Bradyrhizobium sp.]|nr:hypothetical protein [Bradyrhizobium sp.]
EGSATVGTTMADINGNWRFLPKLEDSVHTLTASQIDLAGNTGSAILIFDPETNLLHNGLGIIS